MWGERHILTPCRNLNQDGKNIQNCSFCRTRQKQAQIYLPSLRRALPTLGNVTQFSCIVVLQLNHQMNKCFPLIFKWQNVWQANAGDMKLGTTA